jgi:hypothetical protein
MAINATVSTHFVYVLTLIWVSKYIYYLRASKARNMTVSAHFVYILTLIWVSIYIYYLRASIGDGCVQVAVSREPTKPD